MKKDTLLVHSGRHPEDNFGIVNPPVYHASTVTFPTMAKYEAKPSSPFEGVQYGRTGTPTTAPTRARASDRTPWPASSATTAW